MGIKQITAGMEFYESVYLRRCGRYGRCCGILQAWAVLWLSVARAAELKPHSAQETTNRRHDLLRIGKPQTSHDSGTKFRKLDLTFQNYAVKKFFKVYRIEEPNFERSSVELTFRQPTS
jgi:hypothetical protein